MLVNAGGWPSTCGNGSSDVQFTGGAQIGYNWQFAGGWVFGLEADINGIGNSNSSSRNFFYGGNLTAANGSFAVRGLGDANVFGTVRARFGFAADRALFYITGGLAWADSGNDPTISWWAGNTSTALSPDLVWRRGGANGVGWTLGAGIEYAICQQLDGPRRIPLRRSRQRGQFLVLHGAHRVLALLSNLTGRSDVNFSVARVGVNYKFGGGNSASGARALLSASAPIAKARLRAGPFFAPRRA